MNLKDGVKTANNKVSSETRKLSEFVRDNSKNLVDRLECFEDIINLEVGDTGLNRAKSLEREFDIRQLFVKYEGDNPTGTQKDRIAFAQVYDALRREFDTVSLATCGNYGVAMALAADLAGMNCKIYIPESYHTDRITEMESLQAEIIRLPGNYEEVVTSSSSQLASESGGMMQIRVVPIPHFRFRPIPRSPMKFLKIWEMPQNTALSQSPMEHCWQEYSEDLSTYISGEKLRVFPK